MRSTTPPLARRTLLATLALAGCGVFAPPAGTPQGAVDPPDGAFAMEDGARLPYRCWLPPGAPSHAILALHGFNDSRDAWILPAPLWAAAGCAVYAPDQRGFGAAPLRGRWAGTDRMVADAAAMAAQLRARHPGAALVLAGESMGGAVLMVLASSPLAPADARYLLLAPAVWGRAGMNAAMRAGLWLAATLAPGLAVTGRPVRVMATDNRAELLRLSRDPLTIHSTRFDTLRGLVDLMDAALAAAPRLTAPALLLYGGHDDLIPPAATAAIWRSVPPGAARRGFYPAGYHLLLRDLGRAAPTGDTIAWLRDGAAPLSADAAAAHWLAAQP